MSVVSFLGRNLNRNLKIVLMETQSLNQQPRLSAEITLSLSSSWTLCALHCDMGMINAHF